MEESLANNPDWGHRKTFEENPVNPFANPLKLNRKQKLQIAIMSCTLAPLKLIIYGFAFIIGWFCALLFTIGLNFSETEPVGAFRQALFNIWAKIGRILFFLFGMYRIKVEGKRAKTEEAPILVLAPHSSMMDLFIFFTSLPIPSGLSAMKNRNVPFLATMSKTLQPLFVSRCDPASRKNIAEEIRIRANNPRLWPQTVIFPEATCANRKALISFKAGAFIPGVPVQPVVISYQNDFDSFSWTVGNSGTWTLLWLTLCQFSIKAKLTYLPVYYPTEEEKSNPKLFANNVRKVMGTFSNLPCTGHAYEDCRLMWKAEEMNMPAQTGCIEFATLSEELNMDFDTIQKKLLKFSQVIANRKAGLMTFEEFILSSNAPATQLLIKMFSYYGKNGFITFRAYLILQYLTFQHKRDENDACAVNGTERSFNKIDQHQLNCTKLSFYADKVLKEIENSMPINAPKENFAQILP